MTRRLAGIIAAAALVLTIAPAPANADLFPSCRSQTRKC